MFRHLLPIVIAIASVMAARGQSINGSIVGVVKDAQEAVIPGAKIVVQNTETGRSLEVRSNEAGGFTAFPIDAGIYKVSASNQGFKEMTVSGVRVDAGSIVRVDLALEVGSLSESVTVEASSVTLIQTESSALESVVENKQIVELPLDGRNVNSLVYLTAGSMQNETNPGLGDYAVDGNRPHSNNYSIDGISNRDEFRGQSGVGISVDAVREFKLKKSTASAETGGGSTNLVLAVKSGTNQWHGSVYEYNRSKFGRARDYFDTSNEIPPFLRNQFGFSLGGPIRRNKSFFFVNYEGSRIKSSSTLLSSVPTAAMRAGDFRGVAGAQRQQVTLKQPSYLPFNLVDGQPLFSAPNVLNPFYLADSPTNPNAANARIAKAIIGRWDLPNLPGQFSNLSLGPTNPRSTNSLTARVDHQISTRHSLAGRVTLSLPTANPSANPRATSLQTLARNFGSNAGITLNSMLGPALVSEFNFGWQQFREKIDQTPAIDFIRENGIREPFSIPVDESILNRIPIFTFTGDGTFDQISYSSQTANDSIPRLLQTTSFPISEAVTWDRGNRRIKAGVQMRLITLDGMANPAPRGRITYSGRANTLSTGYSLADFQLGLPASSLYVLPDTENYRTWEKAMFVQHDWQLWRRLTLNIGLRWEQRPPVTEAGDGVAGFDLQRGKIVVPSPGGKMPAKANPVLLEQYRSLIITATEVGWDERRLFNTDNNNWAPRVGLALRLDRSGKTVLRSAYGVFYSFFPFQQGLGPARVVPFAISASISSNVADPLTTLNPFRARAGSPITFDTFERDFRDGYNQQWNLVIERAFLRETVLSMTYVGNHGVHLPWVTPFAATFTGFNNLSMRSSRGNSIHNSLQVELRRRYAKGVFYQVNWTWAKSIDDHMLTQSGAIQLYSTNLRLSRADSDFVRRHVVRGNFLYQFPVGRGQRFGSHWNTVLDAVMGGWTLGSIGSFTTGGFMTPTVQGAQYTGRPDVVAGVSVRLSDSDRQRRASETGDLSWLDRSKRAFNPGAFQVVDVEAGQIGNAGRNTIVLPIFFNLDGVLSKSFRLPRLPERARLTARVEAFNMLNHTNFAGGTGTSSSLNITINSPNAGAFTRTNGNPRQLQFAIRLEF